MKRFSACENFLKSKDSTGNFFPPEFSRVYKLMCQILTVATF